jgi:adenosylcobinamide hydrolase
MYEPALEAYPAAGPGSPASAVLLWRLPEDVRAASTAPFGGGLGTRRWILNATVPPDYARHDPQAHVSELARHFGLLGHGVGMLTAVDVVDAHHAMVDEVAVTATVGLRHPTWAAAGTTRTSAGPRAPVPAGTINIVAFLPEPMSDAALLNAILTGTEAKTQALLEASVPGTGTASDAICIACPSGRGADLHPFCGPRSRWGEPLARAVHAAVAAGCATRATRIVAAEHSR